VSSSLLQFARTNDAAAATSKKLLKQKLLADYFRDLGDDDLRLAVRYSAGRPFPSTNERTLGIGGATLSDVVLSILQLNPRTYHDLVVRHGEIGNAIAEVWTIQPTEPVLMLGDVAVSFDELTSTGNIQQKKSILGRLFVRCVNPREAGYLTKIIFGDLRTGVQEGVIQAAIAEAFGKTLAMVQRCQLMIGDLDEVAVLAKHDQLESAKFRLFHPIQFMLATPQESAEVAGETIAGRNFFVEDKLDGIRAQIHKSVDRIAIYTRTMDRIDESFPDVVDTIRSVRGEFLIDGEIVPYRDGRVLPFAHIQRRLGRKTLTLKILRDDPAVFIGFDLLYFNGELLTEQPLRRRRELLSNLPVLITTLANVITAAEIDSAFLRSRQSRNEGLVLKDPESIYSPGRRGKMWLKLKTQLPTFDCVVTAAEFGHGKRRNTLSDYTFAVWDGEPNDPEAKLVNIGKAFSGVTDEEIAQLTEIFLNLSSALYGSVYLVQPKIVLEIACDQIQKSKRHESGYALRFPRIKRVRWDKGPRDADRLSRIVEIYQSTHNFGRGSADDIIVPAEPTLFDGFPVPSPGASGEG
jgi:DNA ligase-1